MEFKDTKEQVEANLMLRINRNIMEFKDSYLFNCFTAIIELIET